MAHEPKGIVATEADVGRRVRLRYGISGSRFGRLTDHKGCECGKPCCYVHWDDGLTTATWQSHLDWAEEDQLI